MIPERTINHHFTYHVAQVTHTEHGSLVDRGANGGFAGSYVKILSRSSRKCTVTGIESHELQGLDVVQCAALVESNHGIVILIMNEHACYGKGHTIHSSGQIEWFENSVDDRSVQVDGKQRICAIDGYVMPLTFRGGCMYLSILGKPTDTYLERYQLYTLQDPMNGIPQSWTIPTHLSMGSLLGPMTVMRDLSLILTLTSLGITHKRAIHSLSIMDDSSYTLTHVLPSWPTIMFSGPTNMISALRPLTMKNSGLFWLHQCGSCSENHGTVYPMGSLHTQYIPYEKVYEMLEPCT